MALLTLREEAETFANPDELKLLLKVHAMIEHAIRSVNKEIEALRQVKGVGALGRRQETQRKSQEELEPKRS